MIVTIPFNIFSFKLAKDGTVPPVAEKVVNLNPEHFESIEDMEFSGRSYARIITKSGRNWHVVGSRESIVRMLDYLLADEETEQTPAALAN